jgi:hypothetical protein
MEGFNERIEGLADLEERLKDLKAGTARRMVKDACMAGGQVLKLAIAERAPERPDLPSGTAIPPGALRRDIEIYFGRNEQGLPAAIVVPGHFTAHVARWLEYGHRMVRGGYNRLVGTGAQTRGPGHQLKLETPTGDVKAHPFIRRGFEAARGAAITAAITKVRQDLDEWKARRTGKR